jgi:hypothetical protein
MPAQSDDAVLARITKLVHEEQALNNKSDRDGTEHERLEALRVELDQCWDLLRQRRALREFGEDPNRAKVRPAEIVEKYKQ